MIASTVLYEQSVSPFVTASDNMHSSVVAIASGQAPSTRPWGPSRVSRGASRAANLNCLFLERSHSCVCVCQSVSSVVHVCVGCHMAS